jgi:hypothetical protein
VSSPNSRPVLIIQLGSPTLDAFAASAPITQA